MHERDIDEWARTHHGLITKAASGLSGSAWKRAIRSGRLLAVHPGVARLPGTSDTPEQRIAAAVLAASPAGIASHRSATYLWGIPRPATDPVDVIAPRRPALRHLSTVRYHRPTDHLHLIPQRRAGIPCTNILRTMCDLGAVDRHAVSGAVGHALTLGLATLPALEATLIAHSRQGRSGVTALRAAIDDWSIDSRPADSVLEPAMRRLVSRHRLPPVEFHPIIEGSEVDFRFVGTPVIVECDGWTFHGLRRDQFERDRARDAMLIAAGWIILRFTYRAITGTPGSVARRISATLERWSRVEPPDAA
jgi:very-short-patch-repair endonuclease